MSDNEPIASQFDALWKIALESFLEPFMAFCFPAVHGLIDWGIPPVFLDTELQQIAPSHEEGPLCVDKLVRVKLLDGREEWVLVHVEVQAQRDQTFAERMWVYYNRIWDRFSRPVISLAVLADEHKEWHPSLYRRELGGCSLEFRFPVFKVIDCSDPEEEFERTGNLFALLVAAHRVGLATRKNPEERSEGRFRVVRHLYRRGLEREQVLALFRLISWLTLLTRDWELQFGEKWTIFEQSEESMTIETLLSPLELILIEKYRQEGRQDGRQDGRQEGRQEGRLLAIRENILDLLQARFSSVPPEVRETISGIADETILRQINRDAALLPSLGEFQRRLELLAGGKS